MSRPRAFADLRKGETVRRWWPSYRDRVKLQVITVVSMDRSKVTARTESGDTVTVPWGEVYRND